MSTNIYNPNDGINGRTGGPYLDQQQQVEQERLNAFREGREPDYENLPLTPGIPGVTARKLVENYNSTALDGDHAKDAVEINAPVLARIDESALSEDSAEDEEKSAKEKRAETSKQKAEDAATKEANKKAAAGKTVTDATTEKSGQHAPAEKAETSETPNDDSDEIKVD